MALGLMEPVITSVHMSCTQSQGALARTAAGGAPRAAGRTAGGTRPAARRAPARRPPCPRRRGSPAARQGQLKNPSHFEATYKPFSCPSALWTEGSGTGYASFPMQHSRTITHCLGVGSLPSKPIQDRAPCELGRAAVMHGERARTSAAQRGRSQPCGTGARTAVRTRGPPRASSPAAAAALAASHSGSQPPAARAAV
jgi:hypothetical protein